MTYLSQSNLGGFAPGLVSAVILFVFNTRELLGNYATTILQIKERFSYSAAFLVSCYSSQICTALSIAFFAVGWLGMTWLYPAEIVPLKIKTPANGLSTSANWAFNFMVVMITPAALASLTPKQTYDFTNPWALASFSSIGYKTYIIFAVINAFIITVVWFFYPETASRSLEEIDNIFRKTTKSWRGWGDFVKTAQNEPLRYGKQEELLIDYEHTEHTGGHITATVTKADSRPGYQR